MADWSMEPAGGTWMPSCDIQLANWTTEPALCAPGIPMEYASTEIFGSCYQTSIPICEGRQPCQYEVAIQYDPIETRKDEFVVDLHNMKMILHRKPIQVFKDVATNCNVEVDLTEKKIHRYPASIRALGLDERYTTPTVVAIGPYYHGRNHQLEQAEKIKHVAAYQCIKESGYSPEHIFDAVVPVAHGVRSLYDKDVVAGIGYDDFLHMMFFDACFLVQYMLIASYSSDTAEMEKSLSNFFDTNDNEIFHDIMLLENQIPWPVVQTIMKFRSVPLEEFIYSLKGCLLDLKHPEERVVMDDSYQPPHLLGLLRFYIVGKSDRAQPDALPEDQISLSVSANELAEIGIKLKANKNTELIHMGAKTKWPLLGELFLAPLSLDDARASCLVSMAALELCTNSNFQDATDEESAVCSYVLLLAMLVAREEDVQMLRTRHVLLGGGLANQEVLDFFTKLHGLRLGSCYVRTMVQIEHYRSKRRTRIRLYTSYYRNKKALAILVPIFLSILAILLSLNKSNGSS